MKESCGLTESEAPNILKLQPERIKRSTLDSYKARRRSKYEYEAAAQLWAEGVGWARALEIVRSAFDATTVDA